MALIDLFGDAFFQSIEKDVVASVGVSLSRNRKIITARTVKSVRAVTIYGNNEVSFEAYGGEGLPHIMTDKPANTKYPLDFKGYEIGPTGRRRKVFELKPYLKDWKAVVHFGGSDFMLARAIAKKERKAVDISFEAIGYLKEKLVPKVMAQYKNIFQVEITNQFKDLL